MQNDSRLNNTNHAETGVRVPQKRFIFTGTHVVAWNVGDDAQAQQVDAFAAAAERTSAKEFVYSAMPSTVLSVPRTTPVAHGTREADTERWFVEKLADAKLAVVAIEAKHVYVDGKLVATLRIALDSEAARDAAISFLQSLPECSGTKVSRCDAQQITCRVVERVGMCDCVMPSVCAPIDHVLNTF